MGSKLNIDKSDDQISITINHSLDKNFYNLPLTMKTYVNSGWSEINVKQGNSVSNVKPLTDEKGSYIVYQALPDGSEIELTEVE
jgi:hypothetical protein